MKERSERNPPSSESTGDSSILNYKYSVSTASQSCEDKWGLGFVFVRESHTAVSAGSPGKEKIEIGMPFLINAGSSSIPKIMKFGNRISGEGKGSNLLSDWS